MIRLLLFFLLATTSQQLLSQLNATLRANLPFNVMVNDVWGYVAPDGTEYALVGRNDGVSIVSLANPDAPVESVFVPGVSSIWRDIKTYGTHAYVTADGQNSDGLMVIDLSNLPDSAPSEVFTYEIPGTPGGTFRRAHNLYIDVPTGMLYTAGSGSANSGGVIIFDLTQDPAHPTFVASAPSVYAHDVYVQNGVAFASEINRGVLSIYDVTDPEDIGLLGSTPTPYTFTHNAWTNAEGTIVYTTDEKRNASVAAYDISEYDDIRLLDEYRPLTSLNTRTIPHNVHVIDDYLSISYYTDGLRVVDASDPTNLVEVANYDTWLGPDGEFYGAWGAYPFLPSGLTLISDMQTGLYVVEVDYKRAARITGTVTLDETGEPVADARVELLAPQLAFDISDGLGNYATGVAEPGTYQVVASRSGYYPDTVSIVLSAGETVTQDLQLSLRPALEIEIFVASADDGRVIPGATVSMIHNDQRVTGVADSDGRIAFSGMHDYDFLAVGTAWGYQLLLEENLNGGELNGDTLFLTPGYEDTFITDLGWTVTGNASKGAWQRGRPQYTINAQGIGQTDSDSPNDYGDLGWFTGLTRSGNSYANDVDGGVTILTSPVMDLSGYGTGVRLTYDYWFRNTSRSGEPINDTLKVLVTNKDTSLLLAAYPGQAETWLRDTFVLNEQLVLTDSMHLVIRVADQAPDHLVEAAFDNFRVLDSLMLSPVAEGPGTIDSGVTMDVYPNPARAEFTMTVDLAGYPTAELEVFTLTGQRVFQQRLSPSASVTFGGEWKRGLYVARLSAGGRTLRVAKLIKQ